MVNLSRRGIVAGGLGLGAAVSTSVQTAVAQVVPAAAYSTSRRNQALDIISIHDLEAEARQLVPKAQFEFVSGGSGDEWTLKENLRAFDDYNIIPEYLVGVDEPDTTARLLGSAVSMPIFVPPMSAHGISNIDGEAATSRGSTAAGALYTVGTLANKSFADIAAAGNGPKWFQLYFTKDNGVNRELIQRAKAMGATAIVFTVDLEWAGNREADKRNHFVFPASLGFPNLPGAPAGATLAELFTMFKRDLTFRDLEFIAAESGLPVVVKGILSPENAMACLNHGAAAIQVSNHGGRQLDTVPASITALPDIVQAVAGKVPVYLDGGVRRGVHVFKALALGASAVGVGRPIHYGLAVGGAPGVTSVLNALNAELKLTMKLAGCASLADISRRFVKPV